MGKLHDTLWDALGDPRVQVAREFLSEKLCYEVPETLAHALLSHMESDPDCELLLPDASGVLRPFEFTMEDSERLHKIMERYSENLPRIVEEVIAETERPAYRAARKRWQEQLAYQRLDTAAFQGRLQIRWGKALDGLHILLTICRELGVEEVNRLRRSRAKRGLLRKDLLIRLHARACQVGLEVVCLLEGGFADGAMARWRTLAEVQVVMGVLAAGDDDLARRYLDHEHVEAKRAMDRYIECHEGLGYGPLSQAEIAMTQANYQAVIAKHGKAFANAYGWAAAAAGKQSPTFADLEAMAERSRMRAHYKLASYSVHAGIKGVTSRLSLMGQPGLLLAGASNAGLDEPGQNTAISLTQTTFLIMDTKKVDLDLVIQIKLLMRLLDDTVAAFVAGGRALKRAERERSAEQARAKVNS